jgi:hypothetical protein
MIGKEMVMIMLLPRVHITKNMSEYIEDLRELYRSGRIEEVEIRRAIAVEYSLIKTLSMMRVAIGN